MRRIEEEVEDSRTERLQTEIMVRAAVAKQRAGTEEQERENSNHQGFPCEQG